jgi:hypothetical protein
MVDASEMMDFLPAGVDESSFVEKIGPVRPGAEAICVEAEVPEGLPSRPNVRRIGAMVHRSKTRTSSWLSRGPARSTNTGSKPTFGTRMGS